MEFNYSLFWKIGLILSFSLCSPETGPYSGFSGIFWKVYSEIQSKFEAGFGIQDPVFLADVRK
jgi:hypothetical protein